MASAEADSRQALDDWERAGGRARLDAAEADLARLRASRSEIKDVCLLGLLHIVKNAIIGFFNVHGDAGLCDMLRRLTTKEHVDKIARVAHGYVKSDEELLYDLVLSFLAETVRFVGLERARLEELAARSSLSPLDAERLRTYDDGSLEDHMQSLAKDNATYAAWHALVVDALPILALRVAANTPNETLHRAALKELQPMFCISGQYNYSLGIPQLLRDILLLPPPLQKVYRNNFVVALEGNQGAMGMDAVVEEANLQAETHTRRVTIDNVKGQLNEMPYVSACIDSLKSNLGLTGSGVHFERAKALFGTRTQLRAQLQAQLRYELFSRMDDAEAASKPLNIFAPGRPALVPDVAQRRERGRERLAEVITAGVLNAEVGGQYRTKPHKPRHGLMKPVPTAKRKTEAKLRRELQQSNQALGLLLDGTSVMQGPLSIADFDPATQQFVPYKGTKAAARPALNGAFGGNKWKLEQQQEADGTVRTWAVPSRRVDPSAPPGASGTAPLPGAALPQRFVASVLIVDFFMLGRRIRVRDPKKITTPEQLAAAACRAAALPASKGGFQLVEWHADLEATGTIEKGVTLQARNAKNGGGCPAGRQRLKAGAPLPATIKQRSKMFAEVIGMRGQRGDLLSCFQAAFDAESRLVDQSLARPREQRLSFVGFHSEPGVRWFVGQGAAAANARDGAAASTSQARPYAEEERRIKHLEADTSIPFAAIEYAKGGHVVVCDIEDTDAQFIAPLLWAVHVYVFGETITGEVFLHITPRTVADDGATWTARKHADAAYTTEDLVNVRERVAGIIGRVELQHLQPIERVIEVTASMIFAGGDTTAFFKHLPHGRCLDLFLGYQSAVGRLASDVEMRADPEGQQVPYASCLEAGGQAFVRLLYAAGSATTNGRGTNWPKLLPGRQSKEDELRCLASLTKDGLYEKLMPSYVAKPDKLPPSDANVAKKVGRVTFRLNHWLRGALPVVNLDDLKPEDHGFMALPGSGATITPENVTFDWGTPEDLTRHIPDLQALREARKTSGKPSASDRCRAIKASNERCSNSVHPEAGTDGRAAHCCGVHRNYKGTLWSDALDGDGAPSSSADASSSDAPALTVEDVADAIAANSWAGCSDGSDEETAETEE